MNRANRHVLRSDRRLILWGSAVFAAAGVWVVVDGLREQIIVQALFGGVFVALAIAMHFAHGKTVIDADARTLVEYYGLFGRFRAVHHDFNDIKHIDIGIEKRLTDERTYRVQVVSIVLKKRGRIRAEFNTYLRARRAAEAVARCANQPLRDASLGNLEERSANELDVSLQTRLRKGRSVPFPAAAVPARIQEQRGNRADAWILNIAPVPFKKDHLTYSGWVLLAAWLSCVYLFPSIYAVSPWFALGVSVFSAIIIALPEVLISERWRLNEAALIVEFRVGIPLWRKRIAIPAWEELILVEGEGLVLRGDTFDLRIARTLDSDGLKWTADYLRLWLRRGVGLAA